MSDLNAYLKYLEKQFPGLYDSLGQNGQDKLKNWAESLGGGTDQTFYDFANQVSQSDLFTRWQAANPDWWKAASPGDTPPEDTAGQKTLMAQINDLLRQWHLPASLADFIRSEVIASKSYDEIINDLRGTAEYKAAFPENGMRLDNGFSAWSEAQILEYRDQAKQIAQSTLGIGDVSQAEISNLIAGNKSLTEWQTNLNTWKRAQQWGPYVQQALSQELGYDVSNERVFAFMHPDIPTPELDLAYQKALLRGQPAGLGMGIRPEEEAQLLMQYGIDPSQAFAGYQGIAAELPRTERLKYIEAAVQGKADKLPTGNDLFNGTDFATLFKAIQLRDPNAINQLSSLMAQETARFQAGGGAARSGTAAVGLLTPDERARLGA